MARLARLSALLVAVPIVAGCVSASAGGGAATSSPTPQVEPWTASDAVPEPSLDRAGLPTLEPESALDRVPTRVRVAALGIDLPVLAPKVYANDFPLCNVAEFIPNVSRPGFAGTTFIYAHARLGMFLPILERSRVDGGASLIGLRVEVWTSDDRRFDYEVRRVLRHVTTLETTLGATQEQLVLQTSEGPHGTPGKTMLVAEPVGNEPAAHDESHPTPHPVACS